MSIKGKSAAAPLPLLKNAGAAPLVFFDNVPVYGSFSGNIEIEVAARMLMPKPDGTVMADMACTGHLRCSPNAAKVLAEALMSAVAMHEKQLAEQAEHKLSEAPSSELRPN